MNSRLSFFAAAVLSFFLSAPAGATTHTNLYENFSNATGRWSGSSDFRSNTTGWETPTGVYGAAGGVRIGTSSAAAALKTPLLPLRVPEEETTIYIRVQAAAYYNKAGGLSLIAVDETGEPISGASWTKTLKSHTTTEAVGLDETDSDLWFDNMSFSTSVPFKLVFTTSRASPSDTLRVLLGDVLVTENVPSDGNTAPVASQATASVSATAGTAVSLDLSEYFSDADEDTLNYTLQSGVGTMSGSIWSFVPAEVGSFSAVVSATDPSGASATMDISVVATLEGGLLIASLLDENFSNTATGWGSTSYFHSKAADAGTWTDLEGCTNMANARSAISIGRASVDGCAISPVITLTNVTSGTVTIAFDAASYYGKTASGSLSVVDAESGAVLSVVTNFTPPAIAADSTTAANVASVAETGIRIVAKDVAVSSPFRLRFDSTRGTGANYNRIYLDSIKVTQVYDPNYAVLAVPTGVAESDVGKYGFTVSWNDVANASGYELWLDGAVAGFCASTDTSMELTGLSDGTEYSVQVKALGDNLHFGDSPLSAAVAVTTLEDAQKIDFTVTGAPSGDVFAGDTVSFTVTAENESTHEPAEVSFSGIAGALFNSATGAFSWTPTESDVGSHTATFSSGTYSTNVTIEVLSPNRTATLFREDFSRFITKWNGSSDPAATPLPTPDEAGWTFSNASRATSALRIGKSGNKETSAGYAVTREIVLTNNLSAGTVSLSFEAAAQFSKTGAMRVFVLDAETDATVWMAPVLPLDPIEIGSPESTTLASVAEGVHTNAAFEVSNVPERFRLRFETEPGQGTTFDCRSYLDTIVVSQTWDASVSALAAPVPAIGEPGMDSLPVSWATVEGATGYDLEARLADGSLAARATGVTGTSHTFTGLADGTAYRVRIRSLGDGTNSANSPWSDPVTQTTVANPDRPEFSVSAGADASVVAGAAKTFAVSAARGETIVPVSFGDLSPEPAVAGSVRFSGGTFSWTPTDDDAEKTFTATFRAGSYETNVVFAVTARPPLAAPTISTNSVTWKAASLFWNEQPRATEYAVRLWRGTADYTRAGACFEDFADLTMPKGWTGVGTGWYSGYDSTRVKLDSSGDALVSKLHSAPVTNLQFHVRRAGGAVGNEDSVWHLYASSGGTTETDWTEVAYESVANGISTYVFDPSANYRRFKWVLIKGATTDACNMGIGDIEARHAGAGAKFVAGFGSIPKAQEWGLSTTLAADRLRPDTEYFLEVTATDGETSLSSTFRFRTLEANKATMMILR